MTKILFWTLLLANIVLFSAIHWDLQLWGEPVVAQLGLHPEKIRLMDAAEIVLAEKSTKQGSASSVRGENMPHDPQPVTIEKDKQHSPICLEWGEFLDAELVQVQAALAALELGDKLTQRQVEHTIGFWVFIPPLKDKTAITKKITQLKERGVSEYFVVQEPGAWLNAISLGVFRTQEAAQRFLTKLRANKIISAKVGKRNSQHKLSIFMLNEVDDATEAKLTALQKDFPSSELKNVSCALTR